MTTQKPNGREPLGATMTIVGLDGERALYIPPAKAAEQLGMLTAQTVQRACSAWLKRITAEQRAYERGERASPPDYTAGPRELRCVRVGAGSRGWLLVRSDTLDSLQFKRRELKGTPGVWGRVAGTPSRTWRGRPTSAATKKSKKSPTPKTSKTSKTPTS